MTRSEEVRQAVLELDGWCCQVCGHDGRESSTRGELHVHHVQPLGMGGSEERDTAGNCITLCGHHHGLVHDGKLAIKEFDREGKALTVLLDGKAIDTWYFHRGEEEELAQALDDISALHRVDGAVAERAWRLWRDAAYTRLDPSAKSFAEFCESWGLDSRRMAALARLYHRALDLGLAWPPQMSATDFRRQLKNMGKIEEREYWYLVFSLQHADPVTNTGDRIRAKRIALCMTQRELADRVGVDPGSIRNYEKGRSTPRRTTLKSIERALGTFLGKEFSPTTSTYEIVRTGDEDGLYESLKPHQVAVKVGKWIKVRADQGRLSGPDGEEMAYTAIEAKSEAVEQV